MADEQHGTKAAYERHQRAGDAPCDPCRAANATYMREYRRGVGKDAYQRDRVTQRCRTRAMRVLARQYPTKLRALIQAEMRAAGLL